MEKQKLCFLGDSILKGVVLDPERRRYVLSRESAAERLAADGWQVENFAQFGCTVPKGLQIADRRWAALADAKWIIAEFGGNDSDHNWREIGEAPEAEHQPHTPVERFAAGYEQLLRKLQGTGANVAVMNLPPIDTERFFDTFCGGEHAGQIMQWLQGDQEYIYRWHEIYNQQVCNLAAKLGLPLLDIRSAFLRDRGYRQLLCGDGIHPNQAGQERIYRILSGYLEEQGASAVCA